MKRIILLILILNSWNTFSQTDKLYRFYDFGIEIDFIHSQYDDDYKIIFPNGFFHSDSLQENTLYKIYYTYKNDRKREALDTIKTKLNKKQMDNLFQLTLKQFKIDYDENLSPYEIPPPPNMNDGIVVKIIFELQFRGDRYEKTIGFPPGDKNLNELIKFSQELFNEK